jgi:hypothetical protein
MNKFSKISIGIVTSLSMATLFVGTSFAQSYNQGTATWPYQTDAKCYQIFYKEKSAPNWQFSVRCRDLKNPIWSKTIYYLKPGVSYTYKVREVSNIQNSNQYRWITNDTVLPVSSQPQW